MKQHLTTSALPGREIVHQAPDAGILATPPRADGATAGEMVAGAPGAPVPLAKPIESVTDSQTTLPGRAA